MIETPENETNPKTKAERLPQVDFQQLAKGGREVIIVYREQCYRLRETRNGKLILNK